MPPPVSGWRMFIASPRRTSPAVLFVVGGRKELGIERRAPLSRAAENDGWTLGGREGRTTLRRCALTEAVGVSFGISTRARVSCVPIWYSRTGAPSPRTTWPWSGRGRSASMSSRPQNFDLEDGVWGEYDFRNFEAWPSAMTVREP